jgi:spoIIIJ-associated protein
MAGLFGKLFGKKKREDGPEALVKDLLTQIVTLANFDLQCDVKAPVDGTVHVEISGSDEELLTSKEGLLLDALQLYVRRAVQHQTPDENFNVLKGIALDKGKSVYFRALPPKDRKVIHQYLAEDGRVKSRSIGEGHFKKIKIYPLKGGEHSAEDSESQADEVISTR